MSQHPGRGLFLSVLCIPTALQPSPRLGSTLPKGGWHNDLPSKVSAIKRLPRFQSRGPYFYRTNIPNNY